MKLSDIEIKGRKFGVEVDQDDGKFFASLDGDRVYAPSLDELKTKLAGRLTRSKVKVSIPFVRWDEGKLLKGIITGIHASNGNLLVAWDGKKGSEQEYGYKEYINPVVADELARLGKARDDAKQALDDLIEKHSFNGKEAVRKAMAEQGIEVADD